MLHIINHSPYTSKNFEQNCEFIHEEDHILLITDGVYAGIANTDYLRLLKQKLSTIYALHDAVTSRGLVAKLDSTIKVIDYDFFATLSVQYAPCYTWM